MKRKPVSELQAAEALQRVLNSTSDLSCEQAEKMLPALIEADMADVDVDEAPAFATLLAHLDHCAECTERYLVLSEDLMAQIGEAEVLPQARPARSPFFAPPRDIGDMILEVFRGLRRHFAVTIKMPDLGPASAALGSGPPQDLFSRTLAEVDGAPAISAVLEAYADPPVLRVVVREPGSIMRWRVQTQVGEHTYTALTDQRGRAQLTGFSVEQLRVIDQVELTYIEVYPTAD